MSRHEELFIVGREAWRALSPEVVDATVEALAELDLYHLPYERVSVQLGADWSVRWISETGTATPGTEIPLGPEVIVLFHGVSIDGYEGVELIDQRSGFREDISDNWLGAVQPPRRDRWQSRRGVWKSEIVQRSPLAAALITLLATRNVVKTRTEDKLAKLGIGKRSGKHRYRYTTTISLPDNLPEDDEHKPTGAARAPHLRRGHIRRQHYGPGMQYIKRIWIEPVFVNADATFVSQREAYNLGGHHA